MIGSNQPTYFSPFYPHLNVPGCISETNKYSMKTTICSNIKLRPIMMRNPMPIDEFKAMELKILNLNINSNSIGELEDPTEFGVINTELIKNKPADLLYGWGPVFAEDYTYNVHFRFGIDWDHLMLVPSSYSDATDKGIVLRFNYTENRELFEIKKMIANKIKLPYD
jgi:hypothetical protein